MPDHRKEFGKGNTLTYPSISNNERVADQEKFDLNITLSKLEGKRAQFQTKLDTLRPFLESYYLAKKTGNLPGLFEPMDELIQAVEAKKEELIDRIDRIDDYIEQIEQRLKEDE